MQEITVLQLTSQQAITDPETVEAIKQVDLCVTADGHVLKDRYGLLSGVVMRLEREGKQRMTLDLIHRITSPGSRVTSGSKERDIDDADQP